MSVFKRAGSKYFQYEFMVAGQRHWGSTGQLVREDAERVELGLKAKARRRSKGLFEPDDVESPSFQDWAEIYFEQVSPRLKRPDAKEFLIRSVLRFWGRRPAAADKIHPQGTYHDLRLREVEHDPHWIVRFEKWMADCGVSAQTRNHYRSLMHDMFRWATHPQWRQRTGITSNPFAGQWRDPTVGRTAVLELEDLRAILGAASFHLRLAIAIAVLAPKLRLANILGLRWDEHLSADLGYITVRSHKTQRVTKRPLVVYVPQQLRDILHDAKRRAGRSKYVITYQGRPIKQITGAIRNAVSRAKTNGASHLVYGRAHETGITFHTLRHTAATFLAELDVAPEKRQALMGHQDLATTMLYTHIRPRHEAPAAEQLSDALQLKDLVLLPGMRPLKVDVGRNVGSRSVAGAKR